MINKGGFSKTETSLMMSPPRLKTPGRGQRIAEWISSKDLLLEPTDSQ
jgi:hypothetical protein